MLSSERGYYQVFPIIQYFSSSYLCKALKTHSELGYLCITLTALLFSPCQFLWVLVVF